MGAILLAACIVLTACAASELAPSALHEATHEHDTSAESPVATLPGCVDVFARQMVPHHQQAVAMSRVELDWGVDPRVRRWAEIVLVSQNREISWMREWPEYQHARDAAPSRHENHLDLGSHLMAGMLTPLEMRTLRAARGNRLDVLFVDGMIRHHWGAVRMAESVLGASAPMHMTNLARDVALQQRVEITDLARLRQILRTGHQVSVYQFARQLSRHPLTNPFESQPDACAMAATP